jgi:hypothetical protein
MIIGLHEGGNQCSIVQDNSITLLQFFEVNWGRVKAVLSHFLDQHPFTSYFDVRVPWF